ncbi:MAG TPA: hypothetical protein VGR21_12180, partial [Cryptosporangiaceae bacterium]|nr:hypothetical protein [Cryptosporangiaceae bacterium]
VEGAAVPVLVHCCAADVPYGLLHRAGAAAVSTDLTLLDLDAAVALEELGEHLDAGYGLVAGVLPAVEEPADGRAGLSDPMASVVPVKTLWRRLGLDPARMGAQVVISPVCGLAGASPSHARSVLAAGRDAARRLADDPEG